MNFATLGWSRFAWAVVNTCVFLLTSNAVLGQKLITQLPDDGTWAKYQMSHKSGQGKEDSLKGELTIRSVGKSEVDGITCRWIEVEIKTPLGTRTIVDTEKFLIDERAFGQESIAAESIKKCWSFSSASRSKEVLEVKPNTHRMKTLVSSLLSDAPYSQKKDNKTVECVLGKLDCSVIATSQEKLDALGDKRPNYYMECTAFYNQKSPFGFVQATRTNIEIANGKKVKMGATTQVLKEVGKNANSGLPENW